MLGGSGGSSPADRIEMIEKYGDRPRAPFGRRIDYILASAGSFEVTSASIDRYEDAESATSEGTAQGEADGKGRFGLGAIVS